jgi:hypothetical protein
LFSVGDPTTHCSITPFGRKRQDPSGPLPLRMCAWHLFLGHLFLGERARCTAARTPPHRPTPPAGREGRTRNRIGECRSARRRQSARRVSASWRRP